MIELGAEGKEPLFSTVEKSSLPEKSGKKGKNTVAVIVSRTFILTLVALVAGLYIYVLVENIGFGNAAFVAKTAFTATPCESIPRPVLLYDILGGFIAFCGVLGRGSKWCGHVVVPILFGLAFAVFTVGFFPAMYVELDVHTVREVMMSEPYTVCFFGFACMGLYLVYAAIVNAVNLIRKK